MRRQESHSIVGAKKLARNINSLAHVQKIPFLQMPWWVPFKKDRAKHLGETCNHPNL